MVGQSQDRVEVKLRQAFGRDAEEVVHITTRAVIAAVAMARTRAWDARIK